mmetsp:Transcript_539/g.1841  ORF Transcript_539/g.1841 Transcript_539/m.1841 type:complete len:150 (+) Transcript_539:43-492(+)|eukprot:CAMPEP_0198728106 /NCGR_PEP_ID=MMETSP1475-20131203/6849_1 /TAXON_ID= ORGANISM="Unidentified sp., Strain CCMP1999" /NCGR_SAMPLE_ID=MMETSP1475 /ASSEMBLY_ACC=CAM_ASM_001111 /LENGTH=149 /DNA_ID=CAMNT_0044490361 /DNA_START=19 /DNA_END=468 /DNA_ORIENTATION=+
MEELGFVGGTFFSASGRAARRRAITCSAEGEVKSVRGVQQYVDVTRKENFSVVMFESASCRACKDMRYHLSMLADEHPDKNFFTMDVEENKSLCRELGIKHLPSFHFYTLQDNNPGTLENFATSSARKVRDKLSEYSRGKFDIKDFRFV